MLTDLLIAYKLFRTAGKGGYSGYILFLQPPSVFFNKPCSVFISPPHSAFNAGPFSHTACLIFLLVFVPKALYPPAPWACWNQRLYLSLSSLFPGALIRSFHWNAEFHHLICVSPLAVILCTLWILICPPTAADTKLQLHAFMATSSFSWRKPIPGISEDQDELISWISYLQLQLSLTHWLH